MALKFPVGEGCMSVSGVVCRQLRCTVYNVLEADG